jgi:hypothetical protein
MVYQDNKIITLNSQDAVKLNNTYLSNVQFNFNGLLKDEPNLLRSYITVLNAQFAVSFYIIDETNNIFNYTEASTPKTINIPVGNYNGNQMVTALNSAFVSNGSSVVVSLNNSNGLLYFTISGGVLYTFLSTSTIKSILGFDINISSTTQIIMPYQLNLLGKKKLFINSYNLRNSAFSSKNFSFVQTIASVPIDQPPYNMINYTSAIDLEKIVLTNRAIDMIDIQIVDENNQFINFRNIDWSITLCLSLDKIDVEKLNYSLYNIPLNENNSIEKVKLSSDEKDLRLLES